MAISGSMTGLCAASGWPDVSIFTGAYNESPNMAARFTELMIEKRSIDYVPISERHGKVWHLWPVWFSGDAHLATVATGVVGVALGGSEVGERTLQIVTQKGA